MNKREFLDQLRTRLSRLPNKEIEERLNFYSEMIDDRMEEGVTEEKAVSEIGSVDAIATQIVADIPLAKLAKETIKLKRQFKVWEIVLLALGSPVWISLLVSALAVIFSLGVAVWSVIVSLWAVFTSLIGCALGGEVIGIAMACVGNVHSGIALMGAGLVCAGCSIFFFFGCKAATKGTVWLTKKSILGIKICLLGKERA